jgi:hypothetical protein
VIEYLVNYAVVGLFWCGFLRLRYGTVDREMSRGMSMGDWAVNIIIWPFMVLVFAQGCILGAGQKR